MTKTLLRSSKTPATPASQTVSMTPPIRHWSCPSKRRRGLKFGRKMWILLWERSISSSLPSIIIRRTSWTTAAAPRKTPIKRNYECRQDGDVLGLLFTVFLYVGEGNINEEAEKFTFQGDRTLETHWLSLQSHILVDERIPLIKTRSYMPN